MINGSRVSIAGLAVALLGLSPLHASAETLTVSTYVPPNHVQVVNGLDPLMACIKEESKGQIDFNYFPSGQIASAAATLDAMNSGLAQITMMATAFLSDKLPLNQITALPGMGQSAEQMGRAYRRVLAEGGPMAKELSDNHILPLTITYNPPYQVGLRRGRIESLADFNGLKIRVAAGGQVFAATAMGSIPVQMSGGDSYMAMQQGTVDGYFFPMTSIESYKLQEVSKSVSSNANFGTAQTFFAVDTRAFEKLPPEHQAILKSCGLKIEESLAKLMDGQAAHLQQEFAKAGVDIYAFDEKTLDAIRPKLDIAVNEYVKRMIALGLPGQEAYEQYRKALDE